MPLRCKKTRRKATAKFSRGVSETTTKSGDVTCKMCGKYLGNYKHGDGNYYSLIATKYCENCKPIMKNIQSKFSKSNNYKARKLLVNELFEQIGILKQENRALRDIVLDLQARLAILERR